MIPRHEYWCWHRCCVRPACGSAIHARGGGRCEGRPAADSARGVSSRARVNGELRDVKELSELREAADDIDVVVDRLVLRPDIRSRLADAIELALALGDGTVIVSRATDDQAASAGGAWADQTFERTPRRARPAAPPSASCRRALSASIRRTAPCEQCGGLGTELSFDEQLIVPDEEDAAHRRARSHHGAAPRSRWPPIIAS